LKLLYILKAEIKHLIKVDTCIKMTTISRFIDNMFTMVWSVTCSVCTSMVLHCDSII